MKHLNILMHQLLLEKPQTGYSLAKEIETRTGWKPSWGSIYPLLENLQEDEQVTVEENGRSKVYTLTKKGEDRAREILNKKAELLDGIVERMKILQTVIDEDLSIPIAFLSEMKEGNNPFMPIQENAEKFRGQVFRLWQEEKLFGEKEKINEIIGEAVSKLEKL